MGLRGGPMGSLGVANGRGNGVIEHGQWGSVGVATWPEGRGLWDQWAWTLGLRGMVSGCGQWVWPVGVANELSP